MDTSILNYSNLLASSSEEAAVHGASFWGMFIYIGLVLAVVIGVLSAAKKSFGERVFKKWPAQLAEQVYIFIEGLCIGTIGSHGRKYVPMIMTFWLMIFVGNMMALFMASSPTADLSFNLAMALIAVGYVQWEGMKANGVGGHIKHFAGPKLGPAFFGITLLLFCIELISEVMKNVSLSLRLFGNIDGGHQAAETLNNLGMHLFGLDWLNIPIGAFLLPIKLLTVVVQALIFCLLTCVYLGMVTSHAGEEHGSEAPAH